MTRASKPPKLTPAQKRAVARGIKQAKAGKLTAIDLRDDAALAARCNSPLVADLLDQFDRWHHAMRWHASATLELHGDGSGAIKYEWHDHPYSEPNQIEFHSVEELQAILTGVPS